MNIDWKTVIFVAFLSGLTELLHLGWLIGFVVSTGCILLLNVLTAIKEQKK